MIKYTLKCDSGHRFDSWFASGDAYDQLRKGGHVSCTACGSSQVSKAIMAPNVATKAAEKAPVLQAAEPSEAAKKELAAALSKLRAEVEKNATYVGGNFAREAREMHSGDAPERPIWGEANIKDAKALIDEGVPVAPLPFIPTRKVN